MFESRPKINIEPELADRQLDTVSKIFLLTLWVATLGSWFYLPHTIPVHFDTLGKPDNYGDRSVIFIMAALCSFVFVILSVIGKYPYVLNFPVKITEKNARYQYTLALRMLRWLRLSTCMIFLITLFETVRAGLGGAPIFGAGLWIAEVVLIILPVVWFLVKMLRPEGKP